MMEKQCANCGKELLIGLDEYGPVRAPVCQQCFYTPDREVPGKARARQITLIFEDDDEQNR